MNLIFKVILFAFLTIPIMADDFKFLVTKRVADTDHYWVNCTYTLSNSSQPIISLNVTLTKDNQDFYKFSNNSGPTKINGAPGIDTSQIDPYIAGVVRINNSRSGSAGVYKCLLALETSTAKITPTNTPFDTIEWVNGTTGITNFTVPERVHPNDAYWLNCTYTNVSTHQLQTLVMQKDSREFYRYMFNNNTANVTAIPGLNLTNSVNSIPGPPGVVRVTNATRESAGNYVCSLSYLVSGEPKQAKPYARTASNSARPDLFSRSAIVALVAFVLIGKFNF